MMQSVRPSAHSVGRVLASLLLVVMVMAGERAMAQLNCGDTGTFPCCSAETNQGVDWYCYGSSQAYASTPAPDIDATVIPICCGSRKDVKCEIEFTYTWDSACEDQAPTPNERTIRLCWEICQGNSGSCGAPTCTRHCDEVSVAEGAQALEYTFENVGTPDCFFCRVLIVDVEDNEACYPPATNCFNGATCSTDCGQPIVASKSACVAAN